VGALDAAALAGVMDEDLDEGVSLLVDLSRATDPRLRDAARRLAASLVVPAARVPGPSTGGGSARLATVRDAGVDLDLDATLERLGDHPSLRAEDLRWRGWRKPGRAVVLLVDASGSVEGAPLSTAVVTAGALAARASASLSEEIAVVAFWSRAVVLRHMRDPSPPSSVLVRLLGLRGGDTTDLAGGLRTALGQAVLSSASRRDVIVLTDGMANEGSDPVAVAATAGPVRVHVLGLSPDREAVEACAALAGAGGGRAITLSRAAEAPAAVADLLGG
jgi:Mg-chelatase subunit ChlD